MNNSKNMMPLDDLIKVSKEYKALTDKYPDMLKLGRKPDGKEYEIVRASLAGTAQFVAVRGDWLKKLNLSVPKTPDEFYEVAKAFTQNDPDGNGKNDTFGFNLALPGQFATMTMFGWTAADQNRFRPYMVKDGKLVTIWDNIKDSIALQKKLYDAGATDKDFLVDKNGEKAKQDWINGKLGMVYINGGAYDMATLTAFRKNNPNAEIKLIPYIESKYGKFSWGAGSGMGTIGFINAACKDPKAAMQYIDFMNSAETMRYFTFGPEGVYFKTLPAGGISVVDNNKNKKEKNYNVDYTILFSGVVLGKEFDPYYRMDVTDPIQKEIVVASNEMKTVAFKDKIKAPTTIDSSMMPALPEDLTVKFNDGNKAVWDILNKAIVTPGYSADKAIEDAKAAWTKAGGDKVDEYYINYYDKNKANLLLTDDIYNQPYYLMDVK
jgi:putative aldouronate transport system substrate-binding protein